MEISDLPLIKGIVRDKGQSVYLLVDMETYRSFIRKCRIKGTINEDEYLERYPDAAEAVINGKSKSATSHYINAGYFQQRDVTLVK